MKKILLFCLVIFSFSAFRVNAQYRSLFGDSSTEWTFFEQCLADIMPIPSLVSQGDTVLNGLIYKVMYRPYQQHYCVPYTVDYFYLREDTVSGKAWAMGDNLSENLVYDLSLNVGDTMFSSFRQFIVDSIYFLDGRKHLLTRRHSTAYGMMGKVILIEGVGTSDGFEDQGEGDREELICYFQNGLRQYRNLTNPVSFIPENICYPEPIGIADVSRTDPQVSIYPNPASSGLQITAKGNSIIDPHFYLSDLAGRIVFRGNGHKEGKTITCDLSGVPNGLYLLKFRAGDAFYYRKIVVQH